MSSGTYDIVIEKGVDFELKFRFTDVNESYIDITDYKADLCARYNRVDGDLAIRCTTENSKLTIVNKYDLVVRLSESDIVSLLADKSCIYDLNLIDLSDKSTKWLHGEIIIIDEVHRD